jgi:hypothetical protein
MHSDSDPGKRTHQIDHLREIDRGLDSAAIVAVDGRHAGEKGRVRHKLLHGVQHGRVGAVARIVRACGENMRENSI